MADVRTALLAFLRADDSDAALRDALAALVGDDDLASLRLAAKDDPGSVEAVARVLARMVLDGASEADVIDAAKAAAQRTPRDGGGEDVALLAGLVLSARGKDLPLAEPYFRRVRRSDPGHPDVLAFYRVLFSEPGAATQLIQVLVQARRASKDPQQRFELAREVAELAETRLESPDRAIEMWRAVIREDGHDARASAALMRLYREGGKWTALVDLQKDELERLGEGPETRSARIEKLLEVAGLYRDRLQLPTMAQAILQRILDIDPQHEASLEALAQTHAEAGRWSDLLGVYARRIDAAKARGELDRQVELLRTVATLWVEKLGNPQRALEPLAEVLAIAPRDPKARALLATIHEQRRDFRALIQLRREDLPELRGEDALALRIELAQMAEDRLGDRREAIAAWNEVLAHHGDVDVALAALARLYERESRWASAAEILHRKLAACTATQALPLLHHLGSIYTDRLHSRDDAVRVWSELLRLSPGHDKATRRLRDAYVQDRRWDDLTALYERQHRLADVVEVLQSAADRLGEVDERVALYRRVASLCQTRLGQPERALKALERTLAIQPDNLDVARELLPIYREQSNWARLMSTYEVLLAAAPSPAEKLEIIAAMQEVAEHKLSSPVLTLQWAARAYAIAPHDAALRTRLERAADKADGWDELAVIYERRIADPEIGDDERLELLHTLAQVARDRLFKPDDAQKYFRRIIALEPGNTTALTALEDIYSSTRRWEDLGEVVRLRLGITQDRGEQLAILRRLARILEEHTGDLGAAVQTYHSILALEPNDEAGLESLARIHRNRGDWAELAGVLERKLALHASDSTRVPIMFELAATQATRLQRSEQAVEGFLAVLALEPSHRPTVEALESLRQADPSTQLAVMRGLLPYYRRIEDRPREAEAMEVIVAAEQDPERRRALLEQLALTYEKMADRRDDALRIRDQLFRSAPADRGGRHVLLRLAHELGRVTDVAAAYEAVLAELTAQAHAAEAEGRTVGRETQVLRRDLLLEYGAILRDALVRPHEAERAYRDVLYTDETHEGAYEALEALLRQRGANEELVHLYRRRVDVTFNQREQKELLSRITELARTVLRDRSLAVATAEELLDLIPDDLPTISLLAEMYAEGGGPDDHVKLEEILGRKAELVGDPVQARALRVRQAALRMQFLGDAFGAVDLLGQVVGEDPGDGEARRLLEELLAIAEVQLPACAVLEPIYQRIGDHHGRIRVLHVRREHAEQSGSVDDAVGYLLQIARLREQELGAPEAAFTAVREAYLMDPARFDTREEVERLGLLLGRASDLAATWQAALASPKVTDPALRIDLTTRLARLYDVYLRDQEAARTAYTALLDLDPPDATLAHEAVAALCRLHLEAGDGVALIEAKRRLLRFSDTASEQVAIRLEIAALQEELGDRVGAALTYSEVLDRQPANALALDALERLFIEEHEWARLVEVLEHRITVTPDVRQKAALYRRVGEIQRDRLREPEAAIDAFQSVLDLKVGREDTAYALASLVSLHEDLGRWPDVEEGLRRLTAIAEHDEGRALLLTRTAVVVGRQLHRGHDALDLLKRVLDLAPTDPRARSEVASYLENDDTHERAIKILTPLYEAEQNWPALLELEELQARKQPSGRRRLQGLLKVAETMEERIGDADRAFAVLCEAMAEAADQPELEPILAKVERLGAEERRADALLAAYAQTVDRILDAGLQQRVLRNYGKVALERLGQLETARRAYERVLELSPGDREAADALEKIYLRQDAYEPLALLLIARADRATHGSDRDDYLVRAAEYYRKNLGRPEDAIRLYERLSAAGLVRPTVQLVIEPLYEETGRFRELAAHLNKKLARLSGNEAVETHLRLGRLYGQELEDPEAGIRHLSAAIKLDPDQAVAHEELDRYLEDPSMRVRVAEMVEPVFAAVADWPRLIQIQEIRLAEAEGEETRVRLLLRIAQIEEEQLEDLERAMASYERLFHEQPKNGYVRDQLARLAGVLGQTDRYAALLTAYAEGDGKHDNTDETLGIVREAADLWSGILRQPARAVPLLQRILAAVPDDPTVFVALESALTQAELWPELAQAYWREAESALSEERQIDQLRKLATLATELLEDPGEAARAYQRMIEIRPDYELARTRLELLYAQTERHAELLELLRERLIRTEALDARSDVSLRMAALQDGPLGDPEGAVDTLEATLGERPDDPGAVSVLEAIAQSRRSLRPRVLAILRPIYERTGNLRRLVEIDEWQLGHTEDPAQRHEIYREIALFQARSPDMADGAFRTLCRALAEPGPAYALESLDLEVGRIARAERLEGTLADALVAGAASEALASDVDRRLDLLVRGARLRHELGDGGAAAEVLRTALSLTPTHPPALALMDDVLTRLGYHEELAAILRQRANVADDDRQRVRLLRRLALLLEEVLVRPDEAEHTWKGLLELEPEDREALTRLSRVYEASGSTAELVSVLERRIDASRDERERRDLRFQLANLERETLKDRAAEIDTLRELLAEQPSDDEALAALVRALLAEERYAEAADVVQERATLATTDERRAKLLLEAARIYGGALADPPAALERYEQILALQPDQDGALADLIALAQTSESFEAAGNLVVGPLEAIGRFGDLCLVLEARAALTHDREEKIEALHRLADLRSRKLDDPAGALRAYVALLDVIDEDGLRHVLAEGGRLSVQLGQGSDYVERLAQRAGADDVDPSVRATIALHAANLAEEALAEPERALAVLVPIIESGIGTPDVTARIERLARALGQAEPLERALRETVRIAVDPSAQAAANVRLGEVLLERQKLGDAIEAFNDAFEHDRDLAALRGLEAVLERSGPTPPVTVLDALDHAYQATGDRTGQARVTAYRLALAGELERPRLLEQLGALRDAGGGTLDEALETWGELLQEDAESALALERVLAIGRTTPARLDRAAKLLQTAIARASNVGQPATALTLATAGLALRELSQPELAQELAQSLLLEQPEHFEALQILIAAARQRGEWRTLHGALVESAEIQPSPEQGAAAWREAAGVAEGPLADPQLAVDDLHALLLLDDADVDAWHKLLALLTQLGDATRLADTLARRVAITEDPAERRTLRYRQANLLVDKLDRKDEGITVYRDMLADDPGDRGALQELEVLLRRLERWEDVRDTLERTLEVADPDERLAVLESLAQLAENRLGDPVDAIERYSQLLAERPLHRQAEQALERLLSAEERWVDLSELYERRAERLRRLGDVDGYRQATSTLAEILAERLGSPERAKDILDDLLAHDPSYVPALLAKASVFEAMGEEGAMQITLARAADLDPQGQDGALLHLRLARVADGDSGRRKTHLEKALTLDPSNREAATLLLELARAQEQWAEVAYLLEIVAARSDDPAERLRLALDRTDVLLGKLHDADGALRILAPLYRDVQDNSEINRRIADALFEAKRYDEAAGMYTWLVEVGRRIKRSKVLAHHLTRLARISLRHEDSNGAKDQLLEAYRIDTTNVETLMTLGALYERDSEWKEALKIYRTMLLQNADQSGLLRRGDIYVNLARAHLALEEKPKARAMLRRGLEEDAEHPELGSRLAQLED